MCENIIHHGIPDHVYSESVPPPPPLTHTHTPFKSSPDHFSNNSHSLLALSPIVFERYDFVCFRIIDGVDLPPSTNTRNSIPHLLMTDTWTDFKRERADFPHVKSCKVLGGLPLDHPLLLNDVTGAIARGVFDVLRSKLQTLVFWTVSEQLEFLNIACNFTLYIKVVIWEQLSSNSDCDVNHCFVLGS